MATELNMGMKCIKYMLLTVNMMFVLTATLIISVGTTIYAIFYDFQNFIHDGYNSPASLLIAIGIIMLCVSIFGCCAAAKESTAMINVFGFLLSLVFIMEIAAAIAAYNLQSGLYELVNDKLYLVREDYEKTQEATEAIDFLQSRLSCCGIDSPWDWEGQYRPNNSTSDNSTTIDIMVPRSCCPIYNYEPENSTSVCDTSMSYPNGCVRRLAYLISQSALLLGTGALTIAFIQFIGIIFAVMLGKAIRQAKTDRERRRWEIREQIVNNSYTQMEPHQGKKPENPMPVIYVPSTGNN